LTETSPETWESKCHNAAARDDSVLRSTKGDDEPRLTLEAVSDEGALLIERRKSFGPDGGTIGRSPSSDWVLKDEFVSRQHARISCSGGRFFIEDTNSTGGVLLNDRRLVAGQPHALRARDRLFIKPYAIEVVPEPAVAPTKETAVFPPGHHATPAPARRSDLLREAASDPLQTHLPVAPAPRTSEFSHDLDQWDLEPLLERLLDQSVVAPAPRVAPKPSPETSSDIPQRRFEDPPLPSRAAAPPPPNDVPRPSSTDLDRLLSGAGLDAARVPPEVAQQIGQIMRVVVEGLLDVLQARQQARDAFRIQGTMFRPRGNNPLKFSTDVQDALHNLFVRQGAGYLGPVDAFEDVFNDLRHHQLASVAAMKKAFLSVLETFDPSGLQKRFDDSNKTSKARLGILQGTPNYWAKYGEFVESLRHDPNGSFRDLFGQVFSQAYEEELKRLRAESGPAQNRKKE
jgi:type VI secretion system protein ImpI